MPEHVQTFKEKNGLRHQLIHSHMAVALIAFCALLFSLGSIMMLRSNVVRLTELREPTARSSSRALAGLHHTLASLRGWVSVGDTQFKHERKQAWDNEVTSSLKNLQALSVNWTVPKNNRRLEEATRLLTELKEVQWHIEDVAQSLGNEPGRVLLENDIYPLSEAIALPITSLIDIEKSRPPTIQSKNYLGWMADLRYSFSQCRSQLSDYVESGDAATRDNVIENLKTVMRNVENINAQQQVLSTDQIAMLSDIMFNLEAYQYLVEHVVEIRQQNDWNVAQHLLVTQAIPRARKAADLLESMNASQASLSSVDGDWVNKICDIAIIGSLVMITVLMIGAQVASTRGARKITVPIAALSQATKDLAEGRLVNDIPITTKDELGHLTQSFNQMRRRLHESDIEVRKSENRVRALVDTAANGILTINEEGTILTFNGEAEKIFGYSDVEAIGRNVNILMPSPYHESHDIYLLQYLCTGPKKVIGKRRELVGKRKDGTTFPMELSVSEMNTDSVRAFSGIVTDITKRKKMEDDLAGMNSELISASRKAGMAEIATGVLHNVGNVLNSVNISASLVSSKVKNSRLPNLAKASTMMLEQGENLGAFISLDEKGKRLPRYLAKLANTLADEQQYIVDELSTLEKNIEHIKKIVQSQQSNARISTITETSCVSELVEDAITINAQAMEREGIEMVRDFDELPKVIFDKQKLLQILINLIRNARHAIAEADSNEKRITVRIKTKGEREIAIDVIDTGIGITADNMTCIFQHGFTTKTDGHGFGLHSSVLAAKDMKGELTACSNGLHQGATFRVEFPVTYEMVTA